jgi:hypothetical protein
VREFGRFCAFATLFRRKEGLVDDAASKNGNINSFERSVMKLMKCNEVDGVG